MGEDVNNLKKGNEFRSQDTPSHGYTHHVVSDYSSSTLIVGDSEQEHNNFRGAIRQRLMRKEGTLAKDLRFLWGPEALRVGGGSWAGSSPPFVDFHSLLEKYLFFADIGIGVDTEDYPEWRSLDRLKELVAML